MDISVGRYRSRLALVVFVSMLLFFGSSMIFPSWQATVQAQEGGGGETATDNKGAATGGEQHDESILIHVLKSLGPVFSVLLGVISFALVVMIVLLAMDLRMSSCIPPYFVEEFTDTVNKRRFKEAFDLAKGDSSFLGRVITAGMGRLQFGLEDSREAAFGMVESVKAGKEQMITYLATIGTLGPMLGLVGTVYGMIMCFMSLGRSAQVNPQELAKGISHALSVTLVGIGLSVPAIFCHAFFRNRLIRISMDTTTIADDLLTQMYHNSRKAAEPAKPGAPSTANATAPAVASVKPAQ